MIHKDVLRSLLNTSSVYYIVVETVYTSHHIERLMPTCRDRGRFKWIAEMKTEAWDKPIHPEAERSYVDGQDLFPRLYFFTESLCNELFAWLEIRGLEITHITAPKI